MTGMRRSIKMKSARLGSALRRSMAIAPLSAHSQTHPIFSSIFFATFWQMVLSSTMRHLTLRDALSSGCFGSSGFFSCIRLVSREPVLLMTRLKRCDDKIPLVAGLLMMLLKPLSFKTSCSIISAVKATMGMSDCSSCRIFLVASTPSMTGIRRSIRIMSKQLGFSLTIMNAWSPWEATSVVHFKSSNILLATLRQTLLSSTMSTCGLLLSSLEIPTAGGRFTSAVSLASATMCRMASPLAVTSVQEGTDWEESPTDKLANCSCDLSMLLPCAAGNGTVKRNVAPWPSDELHSNWPPRHCTRWKETLRPRPRPCWSRERSSNSFLAPPSKVTWVQYLWKHSCTLSSSIPGPVSVTVKQ
mmetsp:Transcript_37791/g.119389  ORF Transcript_37791/g.119389 Transcript_37791/m.119389 type:complete len:358 (-) Transcript_37791:1440-2513(-)